MHANLVRGIWVLLLSWLLSSQAFAQVSQPIALGERQSIESEILKQNRPYLVYLPPSYTAKHAASRRFPVADETHVSSPLMGLYRGLLFTYPRSQSE